jgi:hypothetical protein
MDRNIALLIDSENISADYVSLIIDEANKFGKITYRRVYGDWTTEILKSWKSKAVEFGLTPVQQYAYTKGKNSSDFSLIIDAMDILYRGKVEGFCIVTSDSDFTKLVTRLKEDNQFVIGMGESKTPASLVNSCEKFIYLDKLAAPHQKGVKKGLDKKVDNKPELRKDSKPTTEEVAVESSIPPLEEVLLAVNDLIDSNINDDGWANWAQVADLLQKKFPGFSPRNYGIQLTPMNFLKSKKYFEFSHHNTLVLIRNKKD